MQHLCVRIIQNVRSHTEFMQQFYIAKYTTVNKRIYLQVSAQALYNEGHITDLTFHHCSETPSGYLALQYTSIRTNHCIVSSRLRV